MTWLATPVAHGLMALGVARLARRVHAADSRSEAGESAAAGLIAAVAASVGASALLNAASRFPHTLVAACFVWSIEAACVVTARTAPVRHPSLWGAVLGLSMGWMLSTRPADGLLLGAAVFAYLALASVRGRLPRPAMISAALTACLVLGATLVILRLQLGAWLETGYSLTETLRPWAKLKLGAPSPADFALSLPLDTGSYCWWPCAPALGVAGLLAVRRPARGAARMLASGAALLFGFYYFVNYPREHYWGAGPRYQLPAIAAMAVGGGHLLAPLWTSVRRGRFLPFTLAAFAMLVGTAFLATRIYPAARAEARSRSAPLRAIARDGIHHAVVVVAFREVEAYPTSLTQNLATYRDPDVLVLFERSAAARRCIEDAYPDRAIYRARGRQRVTLLIERAR